MALPVIRTGDPELKVIAFWLPKYQLLNSPWEKTKQGKIRKVKIKNRVNLRFITSNYD